MKKYAMTLTSALLVATLSGCSENTTSQQPVAEKAISDTVELASNPLLAEYSGPYGGVPAFDKMDLADLSQHLKRAWY